MAPRKQNSWGQHGADLDPVGPRWAPCWPHEPAIGGDFESPWLTSFKMDGKIGRTSSVDSGALSKTDHERKWILLWLFREQWVSVRYITMVNTLRPEQNGPECVGVFPCAFYQWKVLFIFWFKFHWSLFRESFAGVPGWTPRVRCGRNAASMR